jgi:hypothetical protein
MMGDRGSAAARLPDDPHTDVSLDVRQNGGDRL